MQPGLEETNVFKMDRNFTIELDSLIVINMLKDNKYKMNKIIEATSHANVNIIRTPYNRVVYVVQSLFTVPESRLYSLTENLIAYNVE